MTRRFVRNPFKLTSHSDWRNLMLVTGFVTGAAFYQAMQQSHPISTLLWAGVILLGPCLMLVTAIAGNHQQRAYPHGISMPLLLGVVGSLFICMALIYVFADNLPLPHATLTVLLGLTVMLLAVFAKNMAAIFIFSRKDTP